MQGQQKAPYYPKGCMNFRKTLSNRPPFCPQSKSAGAEAAAHGLSRVLSCSASRRTRGAETERAEVREQRSYRCSYHSSQWPEQDVGRKRLDCQVIARNSCSTTSSRCYKSLKAHDLRVPAVIPSWMRLCYMRPHAALPSEAEWDVLL